MQRHFLTASLQRPVCSLGIDCQFTSSPTQPLNLQIALRCQASQALSVWQGGTQARGKDDEEGAGPAAKGKKQKAGAAGKKPAKKPAAKAARKKPAKAAGGARGKKKK